MSTTHHTKPDDSAVLRAWRALEDRRRLPKNRTATRLCLGCRQPFESRWCGNRLCRACAP